MKPNKPSDAHCWHTTESYTNSFNGSERAICCHCATMATRNFSAIPDPEHGPYSPTKKRVWTSWEWPGGPCVRD
jgi:hypothetical protein